MNFEPREQVKPGDLAVIINASNPAAIGKVVRCIGWRTTGVIHSDGSLLPAMRRMHVIGDDMPPNNPMSNGKWCFRPDWLLKISPDDTIREQETAQDKGVTQC